MTTEKLDLSSPDLVNENFEKLAELFPNCVTESAEGKAIDFDLLKQELNHAVVEGNKERYRLEWPGKKEAIVTANLPTTKTLRPIREDSVDFDNTENLYIEGDNLEVLKLLQESYLGKIKMIYIDPPYNTGKDFVYKDNFTQDSEEYKQESGQKDEYNQRLFQNADTSGRYHSDWLSMLFPRLKLARNLLTEDGAVFISIDDNELGNLIKLCDEIFGEANFIATFLWEKRKTRENRKEVSTRHDYIVCYARDRAAVSRVLGLMEMDDEAKSRYKNPDNDPRGVWTSVPAIAQAGHGTKNQFYTLITPSGREVDPPSGSCWRYTKTRMDEAIADNRIWFGSDGGGVPRIKKFITEGQQGLTVETIWWAKEVGTNDSAKRELTKLFNGTAVFDTPKPTGLISRMLEIASEESSIVLDFFSGSAPLADAVLSHNALKSNSQKFILVQIPEETESGSEAYKAGYNNLCEIGKERIRRAAKKVKKETEADIDYGFRVYRLDESNMQDVYYKPQEYTQDNLELFSDNVKPDRTADDLLAQVMLDWGLPLSLKIEQVDINGKRVFKVAENSLFACFDDGIDEAFAKEIAKDEPLRIVFKDSGFKDDTAKTNVKQLLKQLSPETEMKVI
ncbi:site-specific DNA-methyltransferase [Pseudozobellia sp. WGM2]|uniref:site-specific DNA-methyltransferase n=1 Tax=Pseudozobellia sp. WGM2 TaxID=2787625 RepID=UPI001AE07732|nr:site-specific DNA-methyltransferase [Pseudozobellia sp. WGM2]